MVKKRNALSAQWVLWALMGALYLAFGTYLSALPVATPIAALAAALSRSTTVWLVVGFAVAWVAGGRYRSYWRSLVAAFVTFAGAYLLIYMLQLWRLSADPSVWQKVQNAFPDDAKECVAMAFTCATIAYIARSAIRWLASTVVGVGIGILAYEPTMMAFNPHTLLNAIMGTQFAVAVIVVIALLVLAWQRLLNPWIVISTAVATTAVLVKISQMAHFVPDIIQKHIPLV